MAITRSVMRGHSHQADPNVRMDRPTDRALEAPLAPCLAYVQQMVDLEHICCLDKRLEKSRTLIPCGGGLMSCTQIQGIY